jgi:pimeloyl-ACP methyl ester carboxylesterase
MNRLMHAMAFSLLLLTGARSEADAPPPLPGKTSDWNGYTRHEFDVDGKLATVVEPKQAAPGRPWVWHGEFFGHKPAPDIALLARGFHIVYLRVPDMLGAPEAVEHWNALYRELTGKYGFAKKVALVGLSRGGLYCYNWAEANPDKVACIYGDAPVCDFKSWPGGKGKGPGSPRDWKLVLERYHFKDDAEALAYTKNPVDNLKPLADAHVPLLHVYGDADEVVPWQENTGLIAERYRQLGGSITLIAKPGVKHHPHGLDDSTPIVEFIARHAGGQPSGPVYAPVKAELVRPRQGLGNVLAKLTEGQPVKIAYFGGSITAAPGWRVKTLAWFKQEYPKAKIDEINAAIGGTGSDLGVFRLGHDVLAHKPDLVFVEFAVNDGSAPPQRIWQAMEGIVRQIWAADPRTDICFVYTFRTGYEKELRDGVCPQAASAMEMLAEHYGIPSINVALKVVELERAGKLIFKSDEPTASGVVRFSSDGVHPLDEGHKIYTDVVAEAVRAMAPESKPLDHSPSLAQPFVADHWQAAKMVPLEPSMLEGDWHELKNNEGLAKIFSGRMGTIWESGKPGSRISFKFRGSQAKLYDLLAPDGGQVLITVDGKPRPKPVPRFDSYCTYARIATLVIAEGLAADQEHAVIVEIHPEQPNRRSVAFRLKNPDVELKEPKFQGTNVRASQILVLGDVVE